MWFVMNKNENKDMSFTLDSHSESGVTDYDETIGFFSSSFYNKISADASKSSDVIETSAEGSNDIRLSHETGGIEKELQSKESVSANQDTNENKTHAETPGKASAVPKAEAVEEPDAVNNNTYNCFFTEKNDVVTDSIRKDVSKNEVEEKESSSNAKMQEEKSFETKAESKSYCGVSYSFFISEKERIAKENKKKKKTYTALSFLCAALFFLIIPLFLLPVFILKCVKCDKESKFNLSTNYNTLKWDKIKSASNYEVYIKSDNSDIFRVLSMTVQPKCTLPRGKNHYLVVAKKSTSIIAVSEVTLITI